MAAVRRGSLLVVAALVGGCGKLQGLGGPTPPLVTFTFAVDGDLASVRPPGSPDDAHLRVALVWGDQWQTEPFCILPAESAGAATVIAAGCRDPFGFVPLRVAANAPVTLGQPGTLSLDDLPGADVLVGDVTARVAYGSLIVYDDRDGDGTLRLDRPQRTRGGRDNGPPPDAAPDSADVVYGASFISMTAPDQRIAFREGAFIATAFYPRAGCGDPPPQFSVLAAGGFSLADAIASIAAGRLPAEPPASCKETTPRDAVVQVALTTPDKVREVACQERITDSSIRYREPPADRPDFTDRITVCAHLPSFDLGDAGNAGDAGTVADGGAPSDLIQFVVSGRSTDRCKGLTHYTLRGCRENVACPLPDWDYTAHPPAWWPCGN